jgi:hypothetical protein
VTPYCPGHDLRPFVLLFAFEYFLDCLKNEGISSFNYSVGLRVVHRCGGDLHPNLVIEILEHGTIKVIGIVDGDLHRNSIVIDDILPEKFLDGGRGYIANQFCFNPFGEVFHYDDGEGIISLCWCKLTDDINAALL